MIGIEQELTDVHVTDSSHGLRERKEDIFLQDMTYGLVISWSEDCVSHVHVDFEIVVVGEIVGHEGVDVRGGITVGINCLIAHLYLKT